MKDGTFTILSPLAYAFGSRLRFPSRRVGPSRSLCVEKLGVKPLAELISNPRRGKVHAAAQMTCLSDNWCYLLA